MTASKVEHGGDRSLLPSQLTLDLAHRPALGAEDFFVSQSNARAVEVIDAWPDWPHAAMVVVGPAGSGKSHLANVWQLRSKCRMLSAPAISDASVPAPEDRRDLVIENIDSGIGDERALFHIVNLARESRFSILITSRRHPGELSVALPDLRSRLRAIPVVAIAMPDQSLLKAVLVKQFSDRQLSVEPHVVNYLAARMERSFEAARQLVRTIDELALAQKRPVTRALAGEALVNLGIDEN